VAPLCKLLDDTATQVRDAAIGALRICARVLGPDCVRAGLERSRARQSAVREVLGSPVHHGTAELPAVAHDLPLLAPRPHSAPTPSAAAPVAPRRSGVVSKPTAAVGGTTRTAPRATDADAQAKDVARPLAAVLGEDGIMRATPPAGGHLSSERELLAACDAIALKMGPTQEWDVRMAAMASLEGLLASGAAAPPLEAAFHSALGGRLRDCLVVQLADRRSSVVKQACHCLTALAAAMGDSFEAHADALFPALCGCVIISIKVMSDAAAACGSSILSCVRSPRLGMRVADAARSDRNAKMRAVACGWCAQLINTWPDGALDRCALALEDAMRSGVVDADPDARAASKQAAACYARRSPDCFARMCAAASLAAAKRLRAAADGTDDSQSGPPMAAEPRQRRASATAVIAAARSAGRTAGALSNPVVVAAPPLRSAGYTGRLGAGSAARATVSDIGAYALPGDSSVPLLSAAPGSALRRAHTSTPARLSAALQGDGGRRSSTSPSTSSGTPIARAVTLPAASPTASTSWLNATTASPIIAFSSPHGLGSVSACCAALRRAQLGGANGFNARVEALERLEQLLAAGGSNAAAEAEQSDERLCTLLADACEDSNPRISLASMRACAQLASCAPRACVAHLERLLPGLFTRLVDTKDTLRLAASDALAALGDAAPPEALLPPLLRALEAARTPRARTGVLEFALHALLGGASGASPAGQPGGWRATIAGMDEDDGDGGDGQLPEDGSAAQQGHGVGASDRLSSQLQQLQVAGGGGRGPAGLVQLPPGSGPALRSWCAKLAPLIGEKHLGLRHAAVANLVAVYERMDPNQVLHLLSQGLSGADAAALKRALQPFLPDLDAALAARQQALAAAAAAAAAASAAHTPVVPRVALSSTATTASYADRATPLTAPGTGGRRTSGTPGRQTSLPGGSPGIVRQSPPGGVGTEESALLRSLSALGSALGGDMQQQDTSRAVRALSELRRLVTESPHVVQPYNAQLLVAFLEALACDRPAGSASGAVRESAASAVRELCSAHPALGDEYLHLLLPRCLAAARDDQLTVAAAADGALDVLCAVTRPGQCLAALARAMPSPASSAAGGAAAITASDALPPIRCISSAVQRASPAVVRAALPALAPPLVAAFGSSAQEVRKAVVFALVDIYLALGEEVMQHLRDLTPAQQKLLLMYVQRATSR
jgi:CLIP-associating protein 1/2